eukprot:1136179-Rhodomonas_salina.2
MPWAMMSVGVSSSTFCAPSPVHTTSSPASRLCGMPCLSMPAFSPLGSISPPCSALLLQLPSTPSSLALRSFTLPFTRCASRPALHPASHHMPNFVPIAAKFSSRTVACTFRDHALRSRKPSEVFLPVPFNCRARRTGGFRFCPCNLMHVGSQQVQMIFLLALLR